MRWRLAYCHQHACLPSRRSPCRLVSLQIRSGERENATSEELGTVLSRRGDNGANGDQRRECDQDRGLGKFVTEPGGSGDDLYE